MRQTAVHTPPIFTPLHSSFGEVSCPTELLPCPKVNRAWEKWKKIKRAEGMRNQVGLENLAHSPLIV